MLWFHQFEKSIHWIKGQWISIINFAGDLKWTWRVKAKRAWQRKHAPWCRWTSGILLLKKIWKKIFHRREKKSRYVRSLLNSLKVRKDAKDTPTRGRRDMTMINVPWFTTWLGPAGKETWLLGRQDRHGSRQLKAFLILCGGKKKAITEKKRYGCFLLGSKGGGERRGHLVSDEQSRLR